MGNDVYNSVEAYRVSDMIVSISSPSIFRTTFDFVRSLFGIYRYDKIKIVKNRYYARKGI